MTKELVLRKRWRTWTEKEDEVLRQNYLQLHWKGLSKILHRDTEDIRYRAKKFGLRTRSFYTAEEDATLKRMYEEGFTLEEISKQLGRNITSILNRVGKIGVKRPPSARYKIHSASTRTKVFPQLKIRLWTEEDDRRLLELSKSLSISEIAKNLNRSYGAIEHRLILLGHPVGNARISIGRKGEQLAQEFFNKKGWIVLKKGNHTSPFDFIVKDGDETLLVNVKHGKEVGIKQENIRSLLKIGSNVRYLYITYDGKYYLLKAEELQV